MSELDENFYRPSQDQLEKIVPKIIDKEYLQDMNNMINSIPDEVKLVHDTTGFHVEGFEEPKLQGREYIIANQTVEINNLNAKVKELETEISRLRNEMMNLIQAGK